MAGFTDRLQRLAQPETLETTRTVVGDSRSRGQGVTSAERRPHHCDRRAPPTTSTLNKRSPRFVVRLGTPDPAQGCRGHESRVSLWIRRLVHQGRPCSRGPNRADHGLGWGAGSAPRLPAPRWPAMERAWNVCLATSGLRSGCSNAAGLLRRLMGRDSRAAIQPWIRWHLGAGNTPREMGSAMTRRPNKKGARGPQSRSVSGQRGQSLRAGWPGRSPPETLTSVMRPPRRCTRRSVSFMRV
jgi:hypothetical protein